MATALFRALRLSVRKILEEGLEDRFKRHKRVAAAMRAAMSAIGLEPFVRDEIASTTLTSVRVPRGVRAADLLKEMKDEHDTIMAGGVGPTEGKILRVGHMGTTASPRYVLPTISALEISLRKLGHPLQLDSGVAAAQRILGQTSV